MRIPGQAKLPVLVFLVGCNSDLVGPSRAPQGTSPMASVTAATQPGEFVPIHPAGSTYAASSTWTWWQGYYPYEPIPAMAFDGNPLTPWNSGNYPPQWVEVDFGTPQRFSAIRARVGQAPNGYLTVHQVTLDGTLSFTWSGVTSNNDILFHGFATPQMARRVRVTTVSSPSWVGWWDIEILEAAPTIGNVIGPLAPIALGTSASISAPFEDADATDIHTAEIAWGDNSTTSGFVTETSGSGTVTANHLYAAPGVYLVTVTVTDDNGGSASAHFQYVVVYDAAAGFVTGGGVFDSPAGAYPADATLAGLAQFGFQSRYERGATVPTGGTQFRFRAADFEFRSTSYQWLTVSGPLAKYKGEGTVNGEVGYGFMVTARDGQMPGGGGADKFRLKVWELSTGRIVYDNQLGAGDDSDAATVLKGGQIQIHN